MERHWVMDGSVDCQSPSVPPPPTHKKIKPKQDIAYVRELIVGALPDNLKHQAEGKVVAKA